MMATAITQGSICSLVKDGTLILKTKASREPDYNGVVVTEDTLLVIDDMEWNFQVYRRRDGKLISKSHRLESSPSDVCLINKAKVAVWLGNSKIVILSLKYIDDVKLVKTLDVETGIDRCDSVAKLNSDKLVVSGRKRDYMLYWCVVNLTDGRVDSTHKVCQGGFLSSDSHLAVKNNTVYMSCRTLDSTTRGVYAYDIFNPHTPKFLYRHPGFYPYRIMVDVRNFIYVCDFFSNSIHQLTDSGQLATIHTVSSSQHGIFYDDQHGVLYTIESNVITVYRLEYSHQSDSVIPAEVLKMDTRSLQMYKEALNEGKEKVYNIRVMVVGQYGVGKTTLTQRLLGKNVNISERHSTDGIDVHVECSKVSLPAGEWTTEEKNAEQYSRLQRLVKILNERAQKLESKSEKERQSELEGLVTSEEHGNSHPQHDQVVSKEHDNGHPQHGQPVSAEPETNQEDEPPTSQLVDSPIARVGPEASSEREAKGNKKDTVMEILQLVNENSGNLEKSMSEYAALALWDFAGQYVFYTTHQTFLTSRAIYLLVIDLSQQITDLITDDKCFLDCDGIKVCKVHDLSEIWLNSIHSCEPRSQTGIPPVILVGTHMDKIPENCQQRVIDDYFMNLREMLSDKPAVLHLMDSIAIDNTQVDPRLEELKKRIFELAKQQPYWGEEKPARWLPLEHKIMTLKASGVKVAPRSLIEEINRSGSVRIEDRAELDLFLRFQHEMGTILYFSIDVLREKIVLDPQWLIDAQKSLITAKTFIMKNPAIIKKWCEFRKSGKLTHELLDAVWSKEKNPEFHDNKDHIILLMEKLNIIARPRTYDQDGKEIKVENYFLAPCMLTDITPKEIIFPKPHPERKDSSVLCYVFIEQYLPTPIFHRLIAACITQWPIAKKKNSENLIFCGCCVFQLDIRHKLIVFFREHVIFVRVTRTGSTGETLSTKLCIAVKEFIKITLSNIIGNLEQSLRFELYIQCPKSEEYSVNSLISVAELQGNVDVPCHFHDDDHVILSCEVLSFWFEEEGKEDRLQQQQELDRRESSISKKDQEHTDIQDNFLIQVHGVRDERMNIPSKSYQSKGVLCSDPKLLCQILHKSHQAASSSLSALQVNCLSVGLELYGETPANGNCFFEAVSNQLQRLNCGVQKSPQQLRQEVVAFMRTNRVLQASEGTIHLDGFLYNETYDDYCTRMARNGEWADHVVVVAMARMLQIDIMIVTSSPSSGPEDIIVWVVGQTAFQGDPIVLGHVWESHYNSLQPIASIRPLPVLASSSKTALTDVPAPAPISSPIPDVSAGSLSSAAAGHAVATTSSTLQLSFIGPNPSQTADVMQATALCSTPSTTAGSMQGPKSSSAEASPILVPTYGSTSSTAAASTSPSTSSSKPFDVTPISSYITQVAPTPSSGSRTSDEMQTRTSVSSPSTIDGHLHVPIYGSTPSTTTGSITSPTSRSTTVEVMQTTTSSYTTTSVMHTPTSGSTAADVIQPSSFASTTADVMPMTYVSTISKTVDVMQTASSRSIPIPVMQTPRLESTTPDVVQATKSATTTIDVTPVPASASTSTTTTVSTQFQASSSTLFAVMQTETSISTTTEVMQVPAAGLKPSITANPMPAPTSTSSMADATQAITSSSTITDVMQAPTPLSIPSNTVGLMPAPSSSSTAADGMQVPSSGLIPSTIGGPMPVPASSTTTTDATQAPTVDDTDRFMHIACLLLNVGSRVLRRLLLHHTVTATCTLDQYLAKNRIAIDSLKKRKILNNSQMDILFPPGGNTNLGEYDITLLSALFNNIVSTISPQELKMIQLLRDERNKIIAHAKSVTVNANDYKKFWNDICTTLEALSKQCGDPDFENEISREIQGIQVSTVQGTSFLATIQSHPRRIEALERLVQALISNQTQESNKTSDDSDS